MAVIDVTGLTAGRATGRAVVLSTPLSFWGGVDDAGTISDVHHPEFGTNLVGTVLVMASGRGSSSSSSVLAELIREGRAPSAIVLGRADAIIVLGSLVAEELYGITTPVVVVPLFELDGISTGAVTTVDAAPPAGRISY